MIVVDTSAIISIVLKEADAYDYRKQLAEAGGALISAGSLVELMAVTSGHADNAMVAKQIVESDLIRGVEPVTAEQAFIAGEAYRKFGKGHHKARLNLGDVFAYSLAKLKGLPLLFKGNDFALTDVIPA